MTAIAIANANITISGDFITTCAGVGGGLLILTSVQEMIVRVNGGRPHTLMLASVEWPVIIGSHILLSIFLLME